MINAVTELIGEMSDEQLNMAHDILTIEAEKTGGYTRRIYRDYTHLDRGKDETLFGQFCEELFYLQYYLSRKKYPRRFHLVESILASKYVIIENDSDFKILKTFIKSNNLTWEKYDQLKFTLPDRLKHLIEKSFERTRELNDCVVCTNEFIKIIDANLDDIKETYHRYLKPSSYNFNYRKILEDFFYLIVVQYAYDNNHYYYISNHGKKKSNLLTIGIDLYESINKYACYNYLSCEIEPKITVTYQKMLLNGEIDFIERYHTKNDVSENIVEIKCVKEISIRYYLQLLLYNFCHYSQKKQFDLLFSNKFKIVNLLTGLEHYLIISISPTNMFNLLVILAEIGSLRFHNMNLVYDLETTNMIKPIQSDTKPNHPRAFCIKKGNKWVGEIYPEITEISIKDYETGMPIINTLVNPNGRIHPDVEKLTGITNEMVSTQPKLDFVKKVLEKKMKNFINCKMMAHNGSRF